MIYDAAGRAWRRSIGFRGGLAAEREARGELIAAVAYREIPTEEYEAQEQADGDREARISE